MKKSLLVAGLQLVGSVLMAQTQQGDGIWTGSLLSTRISIKNDQDLNSTALTSQNWTLSVNRGVFVKDNWLVGAGLYGVLATSNNRAANFLTTYSQRQTGSTVGLSGYTRRYWGKEQWRVFLGVGLALGYVGQRYKVEGIENTTPNQHTFTVNPLAQLGATYFLTNRLGLEASAGSNSFPFSFNSLNLGLVLVTGSNTIPPLGVVEAAQTQKGRWVLSGSFSFNTTGLSAPQTADKTRTYIAGLSPSVGFFVGRNTLLGVGVPLVFNWGEGNRTVTYGLAPYLRRYISDRRLRPFVEGELSYVANRSKSSGSGTTTLGVGGITGRAGLAYLLGDRFIVQGALGRINFTRTFYGAGNLTRQWSGDFSATLSPSFDIIYVFR